MVPWAGRLRAGRFRFDGVDHTVPLTLGPHAIHGTGWQQEWRVLAHDVERVEMTCELDWPLGGSAVHIVEVEPEQLRCSLTVHAGEQPMPAVVGWHPWFRKPVATAFGVAAMYRRDGEHVAVDEIVDPKEPPWDDCFVGVRRPLRLRIHDLEVEVDSDCDHWVIFDELSAATCVEPQSGPPDAFNMPGRATRLEPGQRLQRTMTIRWA